MPQSISRFFSTIDLSKKQFGSIMAVGAAIGILTWLISLLLERVFIDPVFCQSAGPSSVCANGGTVSIVVATIVANVIGLLALIRLKVYRPLLVVIATIIALFGLHSWTWIMSWYEATVWYALVYALGYGLFAWLARTLSFAITIVFMILVIALMRVLMAVL